MTNRPQFRQINIADVSDRDIDSISDSMNVPKLLRPDSQPVTAGRQPAVTPPNRQAVTADLLLSRSNTPQKVTFRIPKTLNDTMRRDALEGRTHVRLIVLAALQSVGYRIDPAFLPPSVATAWRAAVDLPRPKQNGSPYAQQMRPSPQQKLSIDIPPGLRDALKRDAIDQGTTVRAIILRSLQRHGYTIAEADLAPGAGGNC